MRKTYVEVIPIFVAAVLGIGVLTLFRGCGAMEDGSFMHCHTAQNFVFALSAVIALVGIVDIFIGVHIIKVLISAISILLSVIIPFVPGFIVPMCMMETMRCNAVMKPFVYVFGVILFVTLVVKALVLYRSRGIENEETLGKAIN